MYGYILRRTILIIPTLLIVSLLVFALMRMVPGDAATALLSDADTGAGGGATLEYLRDKLGLNKPFHEAYVSWLGGVLTGDLGNSLRTGDPVIAQITRRLPVSLELTLLSMAVGILIGVPAGIISAVKSDGIIDYTARFFSVGAQSLPNFWLGIMLILIPFQLWGYAPPINYVSFSEDPLTNLRIMLPPALALGAGISAAILRMTRTNLLEVIRSDYIRTARAKGLGERVVIIRHALRNALIPSVEIIMSQFGRLLSGVVIIEVIFGLPGLGRATVDAITWRDYVSLQSFVLFAALTVLTLNIVTDMLYAWLDPRIRYG
jgi:peptide/nickel transport system permease protein